MTTWTKEKPTVPGVYLFYFTFSTNNIGPLLSEFDTNMLDSENMRPEHYNDHVIWLGPIQPPPLPNEGCE